MNAKCKFCTCPVGYYRATETLMTYSEEDLKTAPELGYMCPSCFDVSLGMCITQHDYYEQLTKKECIEILEYRVECLRGTIDRLYSILHS